jgi:PAS domain S-box-containing protein
MKELSEMAVKDKTKDHVTYARFAQLNAGASCNDQDWEEMQKEDSAQILVVDDTEVDLEMLKHILLSHGYKVRSASSGTSALKSVALDKPELILLDVKMPDMGGYEVCRCLKSDTKNSGIPVIFMSALDTYEDRVEGFQAGCVDYITKPFQPVEVLARVATHLLLRRLQRKLETQSALLVKEINERTQVESQLRRSEEKYRRIYENIQDVYYEVDLDGIIQELSPSIERISKYARDELIGSSVYNIYANPEDRENFLVDLRKTGVVRDYEAVMKERDGRILTVSLCAELVFDEKGIPQKILGSLRDITNRKLAEEALRESEIKYRSIFETTAAATIIIEEDTTISLVNDAFEKLSGISREKMEGKRSWTEFVVEDDLPRMREYHRIRRVDPHAAPRNYEFRFVDKDGQIKDAFMTIAIIPETKKSVASILDITERKRSERALKKREKELEVKSRNLEELNTALKVLLKQREVDKEELAERTLSNVKHLVLPYIEKLKKGGLDAKDEAYIGIVETNLKEIVSPFSQRLSSKFMTLTPKELQVAYLIKEGKTTKEIAELLNASLGTIDFHRNNIRNKLNLKNKRANLRSYLLTLT